MLYALPVLTRELVFSLQPNSGGVIHTGSLPTGWHCSPEVLCHSILQLHATNASLAVASSTSSMFRKRSSGPLKEKNPLQTVVPVVASRNEEIWLGGDTRDCQPYIVQTSTSHKVYSNGSYR